MAGGFGFLAVGSGIACALGSRLSARALGLGLGRWALALAVGLAPAS